MSDSDPTLSRLAGLGLALLLGALPPATLAQTPGTAAQIPKPQDFAQGLHLAVEGDGLYGLELPDAVYAGVTRPDLGDLRVFDAQGQRVPHSLRRPEPPSPASAEPLPVPFFPWHESPAPGRPGWSIQVGADGALVQMKSGEASIPGGQPRGYLLDLSRFAKQPLDQLRLNWGDHPPGGFVVEIQIEASDDLAHWRPAGEAALADLEFAEQRLERSRLVPRAWGTYLRLTWPSSQDPIHLKEVQALPAAAKAVESNRRRIQVKGRSSDEFPGQFEFDSGGLMPVERIQVLLAQANLMPALLQSRAGSDATWQRRYQGTLYDLTVDGIRLRNEPLLLGAPTSDRFWRLESRAEAGDWGGDPSLELEWVAHRLLFLARGPGPYLLAFGSGRVGPAPAEQGAVLERLVQDPSQVKPAKPLDQATLAGDQARVTPPEPPPWRAIGLWGLLILAVLVLGAMAWRLYQQMMGSGRSGMS